MIAAAHPISEAMPQSSSRLVNKPAQQGVLGACCDGCPDLARDDAALVDLAGCDSDNIKTAIQDEAAEVEDIYRRFAAQAQSAGEEAVAARFDEIREDERAHFDALEAALERLEVPA